MFIDGPYGTPIQGLATVDHAILIAAGIGVTPFASVLQHLLNEKRNTTQSKEKGDFRLKKVNQNKTFMSVTCHQMFTEVISHAFGNFV